MKGKRRKQLANVRDGAAAGDAASKSKRRASKQDPALPWTPANRSFVKLWEQSPPEEWQSLGRLRVDLMYARRELAWYEENRAPERAEMTDALAPAFDLLDDVGPHATITQNEAAYIRLVLYDFKSLCRQADDRRLAAAIEGKHRDQKVTAGKARAAQRKRRSKARIRSVLALYRKKLKAGVPEREIAGDVAKALKVSASYVRAIAAKHGLR